MRSSWTPAIKRRPGFVLRGRIARHGTKRKFVGGIESSRPPVAHLLVREVDPAVVPRIAVPTVARLHGDQRSLRGVAGGVLEERTGGIGVILAPVQKRRNGRDTARFTQFIEQRAAVTRIIAAKGRSSGRIGGQRRRSMLEQLGVEERQRLFKRIRLRPWNSSLHRRSFQPVRNETRHEKVDGIFQPARVVAGVREKKVLLSRLGRFIDGLHVIKEREHYFVLRCELLADFRLEFVRLEEIPKLVGAWQFQCMVFGNHALTTHS